MKPFEYIGETNNRMVFRHGNYVIKFPLTDRGVEDNYHEQWVSSHKERYSYCKYARCRLLGTILVMQYARFPGQLSDETGFISIRHLDTPELDWAMSIDCMQVGYNRFGEIVAYDYGIN